MQQKLAHDFHVNWKAGGDFFGQDRVSFTQFVKP